MPFVEVLQFFYTSEIKRSLKCVKGSKGIFYFSGKTHVFMDRRLTQSNILLRDLGPLLSKDLFGRFLIAQRELSQFYCCTR